jgi:hypothetical protein
MGGVEAGTPAHDDPEAPLLSLDGMALFGGIAVGAKADREVLVDKTKTMA